MCDSSAYSYVHASWIRVLIWRTQQSQNLYFFALEKWLNTKNGYNTNMYIVYVYIIEPQFHNHWTISIYWILCLCKHREFEANENGISISIYTLCVYPLSFEKFGKLYCIYVCACACALCTKSIIEKLRSVEILHTVLVIWDPTSYSPTVSIWLYLCVAHIHIYAIFCRIWEKRHRRRK